MNLLLGISLLVLGAAGVCCAGFNWKFAVYVRKATLLEKMFGEAGSRIVLGIGSMFLFWAAIICIYGVAGADRGLGVGEAIEFRAKDGGSAISAPRHWQAMPGLNADADIEIADVDSGCYLVVLSESKAAAGVDLEEYSRLSSQSILDSIENADRKGGGKEFRIGGLRAMRLEIHGSINSVGVVYILAVAAGKERFYQIIAWSPLSKFEENRPRLESAIGDFRELQ